jgi:hypothetical protein
MFLCCFPLEWVFMQMSDQVCLSLLWFFHADGPSLMCLMCLMCWMRLMYRWAKYESFVAGKSVFEMGDLADSIYLIVQGSINIASSSTTTVHFACVFDVIVFVFLLLLLLLLLLLM